MRTLKRLALAAAAVAALAVVGVAAAAQTSQPLVFEQPGTQYLAPLQVLEVDLDITAAAPAEGLPGGDVTISVADGSFGVCSVHDNGPSDFSVDAFNYGDCTVTAHRAGVPGPNGHPARSVTRTFKVLPDEPTTSNVVQESLSGLPIIVVVEGKDHKACDEEGFILRSFPTKGIIGEFTNFVCIDDGEGGSVFQAQAVYTPLAGAKGEDIFSYAASNAGRHDKSPATVTIKLTPPVTAPGAPVISSVTPKGDSVTVIFQAPASDGNSPIIDYLVSASNGQGVLGVVVPGNQTFATIVGLEDGQVYSVVVVARNVAGSSLPSAPAFVSIDDKPETAQYSLLFRWNLVSWAGADGIPVADALAGTGANSAGNDITSSVVAVYGWSGASQRWLAYFPTGVNVPGANDLHTLSQGQPYWVSVSGNVTWTVQVD